MIASLREFDKMKCGVRPICSDARHKALSIKGSYCSTGYGLGPFAAREIFAEIMTSTAGENIHVAPRATGQGW
jgi:hypothetical protein